MKISLSNYVLNTPMTEIKLKTKKKEKNPKPCRKEIQIENSKTYYGQHNYMSFRDTTLESFLVI